MRPKTQESKLALRRHMRARSKRLTPAQRSAASARACALLVKQGVWKKARSILFYAPLPAELDVWPLVAEALAAGKRVALPRFDSETNRYVACRIQSLDGDITSGRFGIREPAAGCATAELRQFDLILVPGMAFDPRGRRLGRGKGFYDQLLSRVRGTTCGMAFSDQIVAQVPVEPHDVPLDFILTPTCWIEP